MILKYVNYHIVPLFLLLAAMVFAIFCLGLYVRERDRMRKIKASVAAERKFYGSFAANRRDFFLLIRQNDLRIMYISPNFEKMTGIDAELLSSDIEVLKKIVSPKTAREVMRRLEGWNKTEELKLEFDYRVSGQDVMRHGYASVLPDEKLSCFLVVFCDNTEEYETRSSLKKELEQAWQESQAKTDFLSKMSHEIRTPMNGILGMLSLARAHVSEPEQTDYYLDRAESLSQFLLTLINDILDMSRIESGKMELEAVPFDLFEVAEKLDSMFRNTTEAKNIHWDVRMQDFDVCRVVGDELRLTQVIINFISNAVKFTPYLPAV